MNASTIAPKSMPFLNSDASVFEKITKVHLLRLHHVRDRQSCCRRLWFPEWTKTITSYRRRGWVSIRITDNRRWFCWHKRSIRKNGVCYNWLVIMFTCLHFKLIIRVYIHISCMRQSRSRSWHCSAIIAILDGHLIRLRISNRVFLLYRTAALKNELTADVITDQCG
jgi:hypothetical protein